MLLGQTLNCKRRCGRNQADSARNPGGKHRAGAARQSASNSSILPCEDPLLDRSDCAGALQQAWARVGIVELGTPPQFTPVTPMAAIVVSLEFACQRFLFGISVLEAEIKKKAWLFPADIKPQNKVNDVAARLLRRCMKRSLREEDLQAVVGSSSISVQDVFLRLFDKGLGKADPRALSFRKHVYSVLSDSAKERLQEMSVAQWAFDVAKWSRAACGKKQHTDTRRDVLQHGQPEENGSRSAATLPNEQALARATDTALAASKARGAEASEAAAAG